MPDYKLGKIYTIRCKNNSELIYIGSTVETLSSRFSKHKFSAKNFPQREFYSHVQDWNDWYIELYEDCPCERKEQLLKREGEVIREIGSLNKQITGRTPEQYREDNKGKINERAKEYSIIHKQEILERVKKWQDNNQDKVTEYKKKCFEKNKERYMEMAREEIVCECGCKIQRQEMNRHKKTKKHMNFLNQIN